MGIKGYPTVQQPDLPADQIARDIEIRVEMASTPPVDLKDAAAIWERARWYFDLCGKYGIRPGIEQLCSCLHTSRQNLWNIQQENTRRGEVVRQIKSIIVGLLESWNIEGHLNPATGIFLLKNLAQYQDNIQITAVNGNAPIAQRSPEEIAKLIESDIPVDD